MSRKKKKKNRKQNHQNKSTQIAKNDGLTQEPVQETKPIRAKRHPKNGILMQELMAQREAQMRALVAPKEKAGSKTDEKVAERGGMIAKIHGRLPGLVRVLLLPAFIFYEEIVLHLSTLGDYTALSLLMCGIFSLAFGLFLHSLRALVIKKRIRRIATWCAMFLSALVFMIFFFIYMQFKIFYDLNTVFFAGGDAAEGFTGEIIRMVTSPMGVLLIALFLLPCILYFFGTRRLLQQGKDLYPAYSLKKKVAYFVVTALAFICGILIVRTTPTLNSIYTTNYSFSNVVSQMGLLTGFRRDAVRIITGEDRLVAFSFDAEALDAAGYGKTTKGQEAIEKQTATPDTDGTQSGEDAPADSAGDESLQDGATKEPIVYGDNILDIDFAQMAEESTGAYASIDAYVSTRKPTKQNEYTGLFKGKNLIFITMESFSGFPIEEELFPTLYKMQHEGVYCPDYFVPYVAATTGSEYSLLKGLLPVVGASSMTSTASFHNYMTLGSFFDREGYFGQMYHNGYVWYYDRNITHNKLGYSEPYMAYEGGLDDLIEVPVPRRDADMADATLPLYVENEPFNIYYITMSGHSPYESYNNPFAVSLEEEPALADDADGMSSAFASVTVSDAGDSATEQEAATASFADNLETAKDAGDDENREADLSYAHNQQMALKKKGYTPIIETYLIYQMEVDKMAKALLEGLEKAGVLEDTVIVMSGDHYPYGVYDGTGYRNLLGELYGYEIVNDFDRDRNNLIIWTPSLAEKAPVQVNEPVSALDVLPTLLNLFGLPYDSRLLPGRDIFSDTAPLVFNANHDWQTNLGTYISATATFTKAPGVSGEALPNRYAEIMCETVKNKIEYCRSLTYNDYYYHVFGDEYPD